RYNLNLFCCPPLKIFGGCKDVWELCLSELSFVHSVKWLDFPAWCLRPTTCSSFYRLATRYLLSVLTSRLAFDFLIFFLFSASLLLGRLEVDLFKNLVFLPAGALQNAAAVFNHVRVSAKIARRVFRFQSPDIS